MARPKIIEGAIATTTKLLSAAEAEFGAHGFDRARLADIARSAGISRPSLLYHFKSKQALYEAMVRTTFSDLGLQLRTVMDEERPFEQTVDRFVELFIEFIGEHQRMATLMTRELVDGHGPGRELILAAAVPVLDEVEAFAKAQGRGEIMGVPVRAVLMHVISGILLRAAAGPLVEPLWGDEIDHARALTRAILERT